MGKDFKERAFKQFLKAWIGFWQERKVIPS